MYLTLILVGLGLLLLILYCRKHVNKTLYGRFGSRSSALKILSEHELDDGHKIYTVALKPKAPRTEAFLQSEFKKAGVVDAGREGLRFLIEMNATSKLFLSTAIENGTFMTLKDKTTSLSTSLSAAREFSDSERFVCIDAAYAQSLPEVRTLAFHSQAA